MAKKKTSRGKTQKGRGYSDVRKGVLSKEHREFVEANHDKMPIADIAAYLKRSERMIKKTIDALPQYKQEEDKDEWVSKLHVTSFWTEVKRGLVGNEITYFERAWASYMDQFGSASDILATDQLMIKDLIILDILSNRTINDKANILRRIKDLEEDIDKEMAKKIDSRDAQEVAAWRTQLNSLMAAKVSLGKEHLDYQNRKDAKLRDLKGSRDQRFKQIEESKRNIFELIKELDKQSSRKEEGRIMEKMKIAAASTLEDWGNTFKYESGELDKPFVSPEGELKHKELEKEQKENNINE